MARLTYDDESPQAIIEAIDTLTADLKALVSQKQDEVDKLTSEKDEIDGNLSDATARVGDLEEQVKDLEVQLAEARQDAGS